MTSFSTKDSDFDGELMTAKPVKTQPTGMKMVSFRYNNSNLRLQTPQMPQVFDLNENKSESTGRISYSANLSFRYDGEDEKVASFREILEKIDEFNVSFATQNSLELFGKKYKKEMVEEFHKPIVKWPKNDQYRPTIKVKLPFRDGIPDFQVYDRTKEQLEIYDPESTESDLSMFAPHTKSVYLIEYTGIWVINKQFGAGWRLKQAKLYNEDQLQGCGIITDSDDEDNVVPEETDEPPVVINDTDTAPDGDDDF